MKNKLYMLALAVTLCAAAFSMPAYAFSGETASPSPSPSPVTTANSDENAGESTSALTPKGNLTLVDDVTTSDSSEKQFVTLQTKSGNTFYLVIDHSGDKDNVYFLNLVDETDLAALTEDGDTAVKTCTCTDKCTAGDVDTNCPVCKNDMSKCTGKAAAVSPSPSPAASAEKSTSSGVAAGLVLLLVLAAGGAVYYFKFRGDKDKAGSHANPDDFDDYDDYDEETPEEDALETDAPEAKDAEPSTQEPEDEDSDQ